MADAQTLQALGALDVHLRKLVALVSQQTEQLGTVTGSAPRRGQFAPAGPGGVTVGDPGSPTRAQHMQTYMMEFSPTGIKQLTTALREAGRQPDDGQPDYLAKARRWGWIQKVLGWAGLLSTIFWLWKNWDAIKAFFKNLFPQMKEGWEWLKKQASSAWNWIWDQIKGAFPEQAAWIENKWKAFTQWWYREIQNPVTVWWNNLWLDGKKGIEGEKEDKKTWWQKLWIGIKTAASNAVEWLADELSKFMLLIIGKGFENLWKIITAKTKDQEGKATSFLDRAGTWINTFWSASKDLISSWFNNVFMMSIKKMWVVATAVGKGLLSGASVVLGRVITYIGEWIRVKVLKFATPPLQSVYMWIMDKVDTLKDWWAATQKSLKIAVANVIQGILGAVPSLLRTSGMESKLREARRAEGLARTEYAHEVAAIAAAKRDRKNAFANFDQALEDNLKDVEKNIKAGETIRGHITARIGIASVQMALGDKEFKDAAKKHKEAQGTFNKKINDATDLLKGTGNSMRDAAQALQDATDNVKKASDQLANQEVVSATINGQQRSVTLLEDVMSRVDREGKQTEILTRIENGIAALINVPRGGIGNIGMPLANAGMGGSSITGDLRAAARQI